MTQTDKGRLREILNEFGFTDENAPQNRDELIEETLKHIQSNELVAKTMLKMPLNVQMKGFDKLSHQVSKMRLEHKIKLCPEL